MSKRPIRSLLILVLLVGGLALTGDAAQARRFIFRDNRHWRATTTCRDGTTIIIIDSQSTDPDYEVSPGREALDLQVREYNTDAPLPHQVSGVLPVPPEDYGPLLLDNTPVEMELHAEPILGDLNENEIIDLGEEFYFYQIENLTWPAVDTSAGPKRLIVISEDVGTGMVVYAQDCAIEDQDFTEADSVFVDSDHLFLDEPYLQPDETLYFLQTPPSHGTLRLNDVALAAGETFTQQDIDENRLTYVPDNDPPQDDYFTAERRGLVLVSATMDGSPSSDWSITPSISASGRYIAFTSYDENLVPDDTNFESDIFRFDLLNRQTQRVSVSSSGEQADSWSELPAISSNGAWVAYVSLASNLVGSADPGPCEATMTDTNDQLDVFLSLATGGATRRYSIGPVVSGRCQESFGEAYAPDVTADGEQVAFASNGNDLVTGLFDLNGDYDVFVHAYNDQTGSQTFPISVRNGLTGSGRSGPVTFRDDGTVYRDLAISASTYNGQFSIAFASTAPDLLSYGPPDTLGFIDVFVTSPYYGLMLLSRGPNGEFGNGPSYSPSISADGRFVVFASDADNLVPGDDNGQTDIFLFDRDPTHSGVFDLQYTLQIISLSNGLSLLNGPSWAPSISPDGRYVVYVTDATDQFRETDENGVPDVVLVDLDADGNGLIGLMDGGADDYILSSQVTQLFDDGPMVGGSFAPAVSDGGKVVVFHSYDSYWLFGDATPQVYAFHTGDFVAFPLQFSPPDVNEPPPPPPPPPPPTPPTYDGGIWMYIPLITR